MLTELVTVDQLALVCVCVWRVRSSESRPGNGARSLWPLAVKVQAPSRCGMPRSQSSPAPPRLNAGTTRHSSGWMPAQW
jgi:hypothetical protein